MVLVSELLTPEEATRKLGLKSKGTLAVWRSTRRYSLPYIKVGRRVMYRLRDIEAFLRTRTVAPKGVRRA